MPVNSYYPDPSRAVKVYGELKGEFTKKVHSEIKYLMSKSTQPITLYVRSHGGTLRSLMRLEKLWGAVNQKRKCTKFIMVAVSEVNSAATYLLVMGHYAYARRGAWLNFHGTRYNVVRQFEPLKQEDALAMMLTLAIENRRIADKLAEAMIYRIIDRFRSYRTSDYFDEDKITDKPMQALRRFGEFICTRLSSGICKSLVENSLNYTETILQSVASADISSPKPYVKLDKIIKSLKSRKWSKEKPTINENIAVELMNDYLFVTDLLCEEHLAMIQHLTETFGQCFIANAELVDYRNIIRRNSDEAKAYLSKRAGPNLLYLWCFLIVLCRKLLIGENLMSAEDAYWLGAVDEVLGTDLRWKPAPSEQRRRFFWLQ